MAQEASRHNDAGVIKASPTEWVASNVAWRQAVSKPNTNGGPVAPPRRLAGPAGNKPSRTTWGHTPLWQKRLTQGGGTRQSVAPHALNTRPQTGHMPRPYQER